MWRMALVWCGGGCVVLRLSQPPKHLPASPHFPSDGCHVRVRRPRPAHVSSSRPHLPLSAFAPRSEPMPTCELRQHPPALYLHLRAELLPLRWDRAQRFVPAGMLLLRDLALGVLILVVSSSFVPVTAVPRAPWTSLGAG
ncbi:hypothetical protein NDU88_002635 [Pleurodeles waltl]|uniref:Uncharacterized protein n=1 Tax=Pleurodeles waltl TaxID=8319 RepID=A0AAV7TLN7_PLEWA|nr:hypothetical protein NDU88_002634 [Pleurodeles waltl]KAJ1177377.1 hypothetical protein NDU88_002635 [Pleurodeles waltl]